MIVIALQVHLCLGDDLSDFNVWFHKLSKVNARSLKTADSPGMGRGLYALRDIHNGKIMLKVPMQYVLCRDTILLAPGIAGTSLHAAFSAVPQEDMLIALYLMHRSFRKRKPLSSVMGDGQDPPRFDVPHYLDAWIRVLPRNFSLAPPNWTPRQQSHIQPLFVRQRVKSAMTSSVNQWNTLAEKVLRPFAAAFGMSVGDVTITHRRYGADRLSWALSVVHTRAWTLWGRRILVPGAGMANHAWDSEDLAYSWATDTGRRSDKFVRLHSAPSPPKVPVAALASLSGVVTVSSDRDTIAGEQVFESYGDNRNSIYFDYHGFVPKGNLYECVPVGPGHVPLPPFPFRRADMTATVRDAVAGVADSRGSPDFLRQFGVFPNPASAKRQTLSPVALRRRKGKKASSRLRPVFSDIAGSHEVGCVHSGELPSAVLLWCAAGASETLEGDVAALSGIPPADGQQQNPVRLRAVASAILADPKLRDVRRAAAACVVSWTESTLTSHFSCGARGDASLLGDTLTAAESSADADLSLSTRCRDGRYASERLDGPTDDLVTVEAVDGNDRLQAALRYRLEWKRILLSVRAAALSHLSTLSDAPGAADDDDADYDEDL